MCVYVGGVVDVIECGLFIESIDNGETVLNTGCT